jgi:hypothetical protein
MRPTPVLALCLVAACAPIDEAPVAPQEVTFRASDFAFTGPDTIAPGMTRITMVNDGPTEHHLILIRIDDDHTLQELYEFAAANPNAEPEWITFYGAANAVSTGGSTGSTVYLPEGQYVAVCFIVDTDGVSHLAKGMSRGLVVTGTPVDAPPPVASGKIEMSDFTYQLPTLTAGTHTFQMTNAGAQTHEAQLVRLDDGVTPEQFLASFAPGATTPPPGKFLGGSGAISAGVENWWTVDLEPGQYIILCFVPDTNSHAPHFVMGMVAQFKVAAS